jgi:hypothetical protein
MREFAAESLQIAANGDFRSICGCSRRLAMMDQEGAI